MKIRKRTVTKSKYFQGEMMICAICGVREKSNPHVSSQWTVIEMDGHGVYVCPECFGNAVKKGF